MIPISYSVRSLLRRPLTAAVTIVGLALVVFVFAAVGMLERGVRETLASNGSPNNAMVLRDGAASETVSLLTRTQVRLLSASPELVMDSDGQPLLAGEVVVIANLPQVLGQAGANVGIRGLSPKSLVIRDAVRLVAGRLPVPGTSEVMVGRSAAGRYVGSALGQTISVARRDWPVVGIFAARGSGFESEIWGDALQIMDAFNRTVYSSAVLRLRNPAALATLTRLLASDTQLSTAKIWREDRFYDAQSESLRRFINLLGSFVAVIFALAAAFGAAVTMNAQVAGRLREVGTLRAIGFGRATVLGVFLRESLTLSAVSGLLGILAASLLSRVGFSTLNQQSFTLITFHFSFSFDVAVAAFSFSLAMGLMGGFLPAWTASRLSIVTAIRGAR